MINMILFFLFSFFGFTWAIEIPINGATARSYHNEYKMPVKAFDKTNGYYMSARDLSPEWLKLTLDSGYVVEEVLVTNR